MNKTVKHASWPALGISAYAPGGPVAQQLKAQQTALNAINEQRNSEFSKELLPTMLGLGLLGLGTGLTGTKLYNIVSQINAPKNKYTKFGPGPKEIDAEEKIAEDTWYQTLVNALSAVPNRIGAAVSSGTDSFNKLTPNQQAVLLPAGLLSAGLGIYGGKAIAQGISKQKKKEDLDYELEAARKEYQKALTGKRANDLNYAYQRHKKAQQQQITTKSAKNPLITFADYLAEPMRASGLFPFYTTAALGAGLLSGKMTYDWTRERSADKALARARQSRARMEDSSPLYIDPAQLEAIKTLHQKEIDKIKQKELV
jgi:hypothetical protein